MLPNNPSKPKGFSGNTLRAWGYLFLLLGIAGQSIIQNRMLGLNTMTTAELFAAWDADPAIMPLVTMALVFQAMQTCAAPIFSFLLVEGILHTSNVKNYLIRVTCLALISELPYNLAMGGKLLDFSTRNPVFGLVLGMITLMFYAQYQEPTLRNRALKTVITLAALVWGKMLGIQDSVEDLAASFQKMAILHDDEPEETAVRFHSPVRRCTRHRQNQHRRKHRQSPGPGIRPGVPGRRPGRGGYPRPPENLHRRDAGQNNLRNEGCR